MLLILSFVVLAAYGYVGWSLNQALGQLTSWPDGRRQLSILLVVILLNMYPVVVLVVSSLRSNGGLAAFQGGNKLIDFSLTYPFWVGLIAVLQLLPFLLLIDLGRVAVVPFSKDPAAWARWAARLTLLMTCVVAGYTVIRVVYDTRHIRISERVIHSDKLAPPTPEIRIVHITDVQVDRRTGPPLVGAFVDRINELDPDVVFFTGDLITSGTTYIDQAASVLGRIKARYGVFACLGDHDVWADPQWVARSLRQNGIEVIEDGNRLVNVGPIQIQLTGVTNVYSHRPTWGQLQRLAARRDHQRFSIFLTHQPSDPLVEFAERNGYDLFLAGHTHGGQVVLNYFGFHLTPARRDTRFISGFYEVGHMLLSVSDGLGLTFAPVRFQAPAEITLLRLAGRPSAVRHELEP